MFILIGSPVALLSWIIEKFSAWTNASKTLPEDAIGLDLILSNISLYFVLFHLQKPMSFSNNFFVFAFGFNIQETSVN